MKSTRQARCVAMYIIMGLTAVMQSVQAQEPGTIVTVAGGGGPPNQLGDGGPATQASLGKPWGLYVDADGNLYITDIQQHRIRKVDGDGIITTVAGTGQQDFSGDGGPATQASLNQPRGIFGDQAGNLYIADSGNHRIRKVDPGGTISTITGTGMPGFSGDDGPATLADLNFPQDLFIDDTGAIFIADSRRLRKIDASGIITTIAGNGNGEPSGDGIPALTAGINPVAIVKTGSDIFYIVDCLSPFRRQRIRYINPEGIINTAVSGFNLPISLAADQAGHIYFSESIDHFVVRINARGVLEISAGNGFHIEGYGQFFGDGGPAHLASLDAPTGVFVDQAGDLYIADSRNSRVRKVFQVGLVATQFIHSATTHFFQLGDGTATEVAFLSDMADIRKLTLISFGVNPPASIPQDLALDSPLLYFSLTTTPEDVNPTVQARMSYTDDQLSQSGITDETSLQAAWFEASENTWHFVPTTVDPLNNTVVFETDRFGMWALASKYHQKISSQTPQQSMLDPNYPNPFNLETVIEYSLSASVPVRMAIYNTLGQQVRVLVDGFQTAGRYRLVWDGQDGQGRAVASGVYVYQLHAGEYTQSRRMTLLK